MEKYNLGSAFPQLFILYKILVTLPISSIKCECAFKKIKIVKIGCVEDGTRFSFFLDVDILQSIDSSCILDSFASTPLLRKMFMG